MYIGLRWYSLDWILRLSHIRTIDVNISCCDISRVALTIGCRASIRMLWFHCLQTCGTRQIAIIVIRSRQFFFHVIHKSRQCWLCQLWCIRSAIRMGNKTFHSSIRSYNVHPIVLSVQNIDNLQWNNFYKLWKMPSWKEFKKFTCPLLTWSSSSTHGVKSWTMTILLSGDKPFSFSMPTLTRVSMLALPVILPGGRGTLLPGPIAPPPKPVPSFSKAKLWLPAVK